MTDDIYHCEKRNPLKYCCTLQHVLSFVFLRLALKFYKILFLSSQTLLSPSVIVICAILNGCQEVLVATKYIENRYIRYPGGPYCAKKLAARRAEKEVRGAVGVTPMRIIIVPVIALPAGKRFRILPTSFLFEIFTIISNT